MNTLSSGNLKRDFTRFCIPCVLNLLVFYLYNFVDGIFVSHYIGPDALAAVHLTSPFMTLLFGIGITFAVGTGTVIAASLGKGDTQRANFIFSQNLTFISLIAVAISVLVLIFLEPISIFLGADADTLSYTKDYFGALAPFAVFVVTEYNLEFLIKTDGAPRLSLVTVISTCVLNIVLDWLFVGVFQMGVVGAAIATGIGQASAALVFFFYILFAKNGLFTFKRFRWDLSVYKEIIPLGLADGSVEVCSAVVVWIFHHLIGGAYGAEGIAAYTVLCYISNVLYNIVTGVSQAQEPLISYHKGAGNTDACYKLFLYAIVTELALSVLYFAGTQLFTGPIVSIFLPDATSFSYVLAVGAIKKHAFSYLLVGFNIVLAGFFTAQMMPKAAFFLTAGRILVLQSASLFAVSALFGIDAIWWAPLCAEIITVVIGLIVLRSKKNALSGSAV